MTLVISTSPLDFEVSRTFHSSQNIRRAGLLALVVGLGVALGGCASFKPKTPEEVVTQRASERWTLMRADKFEPSYELTAPSYRAVKDYKSYRALYGPSGAWTDAKVAKVECSSDTVCAVVMEITVQNVSPMRGAPTLTTALDENWIKEGDRWYFLPRL